MFVGRTKPVPLRHCRYLTRRDGKPLTYLLLDDAFGEHEKIEPLTDKAFRAHVLALLHCAKNLTDGYVSDIALRAIAARVASKPARFTEELARYGLWKVIPGGVMIHDYLEHNPSSEVVQSKRKARADAGRRGGIASGQVRSKPEAFASPSVEPHPIPSHKSEAFIPAFTSYEGGDDSTRQEAYNHALERLITLCGGSDETRMKLTEQLVRHPAPEARLVAIHWSVSQRGTRDRLGKALSMIRKEAA